MIVTQHAIARYIERVAPWMTDEQARAEIERHAPAVDTAARFGCQRVILGNGARLILAEGDKVTTVTRGQPREHRGGR